MQMCHAISRSFERKFKNYTQQLSLANNHRPDQLSRRLLILLEKANKEMDNMADFISTKAMRYCFRLAFKSAVTTNYEKIATELLEFCSQNSYNLQFDFETMQHMIQLSMYEIIQMLVKSNAVLVRHQKKKEVDFTRQVGLVRKVIGDGQGTEGPETEKFCSAADFVLNIC